MSTGVILSNFKIVFIYTIEYFFLLFIFGLFFSIIEKRNSKAIMNAFGRRGILFTGFIGTIVHELSHLFFCFIFRHEIIEYSLFRPIKSRYDGVMGYVNHRCNLNSPYQCIGNFFIGIAPILFGTFFLIISMTLILPNEFSTITKSFIKNMEYMYNIKSFTDMFNIHINIILSILSNLSPFKEHNWIRYIIYIYIMYSVTTHMDLSLEDIKNSKSGLIFFFVLVLIINSIVVFLGIEYTVGYLKFLVSTTSFLMVALLFSVMTMLISILAEVLMSN